MNTIQSIACFFFTNKRLIKRIILLYITTPKNNIDITKNTTIVNKYDKIIIYNFNAKIWYEPSLYFKLGW